MSKYVFLVIAVLFVLFSSCSTKPSFDPSDHFNGEAFHNIDEGHSEKSFLDFIKWKFFSQKTLWPEFIAIDQKKVPLQRVNTQAAHITFINHATVLIQMNNINILTDPIYSKRASPVGFAGPKRVKKPGIKFEDLPPIDIILISHNHYDHFDIPTIERLIQRDQSLVLVGLHHDHYIQETFKDHIVELDWNEQYLFKEVLFTFLEAKHWSKRTLFDTNQSLWGSFAIEGNKRIYFAGDTGYSQHFKRIQSQFKSFDLSLIPIGAYEPRWFMKASHLNPQEAVQAHLDLQSKHSIGIHFGTFSLTNEGINDPVKALHKAKKSYDQTISFFTLKEGETYFLQ